MKKIRIILMLLTAAAFLSTAHLQAQTIDTGVTSTMSSDAVSDQAGQRQDKGMNAWLISGALVGIGIIGAIVMRMRRKGDSRPQTGGDINNPASGI